MNRRDFMKTTILASAATPRVAQRHGGARPERAASRGVHRLRRTRTAAHAAIVAMPDVEIVALCDAYTGRRSGRRRAPAAGDDLHRLQRSAREPTIDAVFIVTPDHWHKTMAIDALTAGKDVYLEKPMSFAIDDGLAILDAEALEPHPAGGQSGRQRRRTWPRRAS